jgi:hypothetical protein
MAEGWYAKKEREAAEKLVAMLALPINDGYMSTGEYFDPWSLFPCVYGSYGGDFDRCAIDVLTEIKDKEKRRRDLGAEMFREMLCNASLCTYGTSPRVCFATMEFEPLLPDFIEKWKQHCLFQWAMPYSEIDP